MATEKLRGIVIAERVRGESNKQIVLLAKGVGRVLLSARGARKANSRLLAATQLFCCADFIVYVGKGYLAITQAELLHSFYGLRTDVEKFAEAMYLTELADRCSPEGMEQDAVLELLYYAFLRMEQGTLPPKLIARIFELKLLQLSGLFAPEACAICGSRAESLYFDSDQAAFFCEMHRRAGDVPVSDAVRRAFAYVLEREGKAVFGFTLSGEALEQLSFILRRYIDVHMELSLKSRDFFTPGCG